MIPDGLGMALPPHLEERLCTARRSARPDGAYVMCWLRRTMRADENPVLDMARVASRATDRPLFVLMALHESTRWASARHHLFALQCARDLARQLGEAGVAMAVHVERTGARGPVLAPLVREAALVVVDEVPVAPWREEVEAARVHGPVWSVDGACVVPMPLSGKAPSRAFVFRDRFADARSERMGQSWPREGEPVASALPALPFEPVPVADMEDRDLLGLLEGCAIDHGVAPVRTMPGGSRAANARWEAFRDMRLHEYADRRNDALDTEGVSGLSPWLNHGCLSPFRVVREAHAMGGRGAEKFLDELLVWREVAWHFCWRTPAPEAFDAVPGWARETLLGHASDPRPALHDLEALAEGRTGDPLWDTAADCLRHRGMLHNNVRMTWGKGVLRWSPDPETALARLIELNHRYALDGRDPASMGGLLWCLGLFDRPFTPEQPILGTVRGRGTAAHAERLDVSAWREVLGLGARRTAE
ncbi:MAG: hypothetical protein EA398_07690 [Deltaproteobacteria bacterium]|nr:MAG: hypothetical protein EA398_07690 [Deltaproteobacteria bacterium]